MQQLCVVERSPSTAECTLCGCASVPNDACGFACSSTFTVPCCFHAPKCILLPFQVMVSTTHLAIVMEYAAGGHLIDLSASENIARDLFQQLLSSLTYCHSLVRAVRLGDGFIKMKSFIPKACTASRHSHAHAHARALVQSCICTHICGPARNGSHLQAQLYAHN